MGKRGIRARAQKALARGAAGGEDKSLKVICRQAGAEASRVAKQRVKRAAGARRSLGNGEAARLAARAQAAEILQRHRVLPQRGRQPAPSTRQLVAEAAAAVVEAKPTLGESGGVERALSVVSGGRGLRTSLGRWELRAAFEAADAQSAITSKTVKGLGLQLGKEQRRRLKSQLFRQRFAAVRSATEDAEAKLRRQLTPVVGDLAELADSLPKADLLERLGDKSQRSGRRRQRPQPVPDRRTYAASLAALRADMAARTSLFS